MGATDLRPRPPGRRQAAESGRRRAPGPPLTEPKPPIGPQPLTDVFVDAAFQGLAATITLGPHPIMDALLSWLPESSYVREVFGFGHRDELALTPDVVHDPPSILNGSNPTIDQVRRAIGMDPLSPVGRGRVGSTPTGSLRLDMGARRSTALGGAW